MILSWRNNMSHSLVHTFIRTPRFSLTTNNASMFYVTLSKNWRMKIILTGSNSIRRWSFRDIGGWLITAFNLHYDCCWFVYKHHCYCSLVHVRFLLPRITSRFWAGDRRWGWGEGWGDQDQCSVERLHQAEAEEGEDEASRCHHLDTARHHGLWLQGACKQRSYNWY